MDLGDAKITIKAKDDASEVFSKVNNRLEGMKDGLRKAGIAMTAMGIAGLKLVADARQLNAQLDVTAVGLGIAGNELQNLALATSNVTFSLKEVISSFDLLTRAGMSNAEVMAETATAFDTLGDAIGLSASQVTSILIPAFKTFGIPLEDAEKHIDIFTWLVRNTTVNLEDFGTALRYIAPDMDKLGLSIGETVAIMAALEAKGISGSAATRELRTAVTQAANEGKNLAEVLGITAGEIAVYEEKLKGATGITQEYADIANEQYGIMDKLKHAFSKLTLKFGSFLKPLEPILAAMTALGPVMIFLSTQVGISTLLWVKHTVAMVASAIATKGAAAAMWLLNAAMSANPFVLLATAIAAVVGAFLIFRNKVDSVAKEALEDFQTLSTEAIVSFQAIALAGKTMTEDLMTDVVNGISALFDEVILMISTRKDETIAAMYEVFAGMHTTTAEELAKTSSAIQLAFDTQLGIYNSYKEEMNEIYRTALAGNRELTETENARINELILLATQEGIKFTSVGTTQMEDLWRTLGENTGEITRGMYLSMAWASHRATDQIITDAEETSKAYDEYLKGMVQLGLITIEQYREWSTASETEKNARIADAEEETRRLEEELNKRYNFFSNFWGNLKQLFFGGLELTLKPWAKPTEFATGGIVTKPTLAMLGEQGPEAVVPLTGGGGGIQGANLTVHIGNFMGDEMSLRDLTRRLQELMREEDRRTAFSGINTGYFYGGSHP